MKAKSEKTLSDSQASYQEQIKSAKQECRMKHIMISKLLQTIENLSSSKKYNNCNITTTYNSSNNDFEIPGSNDTHLAPPKWDISKTHDTTTKADGRSINVMPSI